jgi:hypothetical protein
MVTLYRDILEDGSAGPWALGIFSSAFQAMTAAVVRHTSAPMAQTRALVQVPEIDGNQTVIL